MSVVTRQTLRIVETEPDIWYRHLTSSPAVTIATMALQVLIQRLPHTMVTLCLSVASTVRPQCPLRRR